MATTVTIDTISDPIDTTNQTAITAAGTTNLNTNTVQVTVTDTLGASVGPVSAIVTGTTWAIAATNVSALADGTLIYQATATGVDTTFDFAAKAASKSTTAPVYITDSIFREAITDASNLNANKVARAIQAASRRVDEICGRTFGLSTIATARPFKALTCHRCLVDDIASTSGLIVKTTTTDSTTYDSTWTINTEFILTPESRTSGGLAWPYEGLQAVGSKTFPASGKVKSVEVTALWGWSSVPDAVVMATTLLAVRYYSRPDAPYGYQGFGDMGALPVRRDWDVEDLLSDYVKTASAFLVA